MKRGTVILVALAALWPGASAAQAAAPRYASQSGSGTACTATAPCALDEAIDHAPANSEVIVNPGHYVAGSSTIAQVTAEPLDIHGPPGMPRPWIEGGPAAQSLLYVGPNSSVAHLRIDNTNGGNALGVGANYGPTSVARDLILSSRTYGTGLTLINTVATDLVTTGYVGVTVAYSTNIQLRNVTAVGSHYGLFADAFTSGGTPYSGGVLARNVIARGGASDVYAQTDSSSGVTADIDIDFSDYRPNPGQTTGTGASVTPGGDNISADPLFVDAVHGNFRERPGSPTIDRGEVFSYLGLFDPDGTPRTIGAAPDIGAFEFNPPIVTTGGTRGVRRRKAKLTGTVNPNAAATTYFFEYGRTTHYGHRTATRSAGAGTVPRSVQSQLTGLRPGTRYHYRLVATNHTATRRGADGTFRTVAACLVPHLRGRTLQGARRAAERADCRLGRIDTRPHLPGQRLVVVEQHPHAGALRAPGARIRITLGAAP